MPTINPTLPADGDDAVVEPYNAAINAILGVINGSIDSTNIAANSLPWSVMSNSMSNAIPSAAMQDSGNLEKFRLESEYSLGWVVPGGMVWTQSSGLVGSMTAGVYYSPNGVRNTGALIASRTFTASKDTYVDFPQNGGSPAYTEVTNGAASPALSSGYIRVALVITGASAITSVVQYGVDTVTTNGQVNYIYNTSSTAAPVFVLTNAGNGGGTFWYKNQNGKKTLWGTSASCATQAGNAQYTVTLPVGFFDVIQGVNATAVQMTNVSSQYASVTTWSITAITINLTCTTNSSTSKFSLAVEGI